MDSIADKLDDIEIRSEEVQEILSDVPHWLLRWGNLAILILILILLTISWFVKYPDVIPSQVMLTTQVPPQKEYANSSGKIQAILVRDNQRVSQGQPLAIIENTANYKDVFALKQIVDTIRINNKSFKFPIDSLPLFFLGNIESQFALFENSYIQYKLNKELQPFTNEALANSYSKSELNRRLTNLIAQRDINKTELEFKQKDLQRSKTLFDKGVISAQDYDNKQLEFAQAQRNFKNFESSISQLRESISNANKTSIGTEIAKTKEDMRLLKNVIQSFNQLKQSIKDWERQYVLSSDIDGRVIFLNYWNSNQTVNQGDLVFTIIPSNNSAYIAKLKSPAQNSGKIKIGQEVKISLESFPETEFGTLNGTILRVSMLPDKEGLYMVDVKMPQDLTTSYGKQIEFKQEMRGAAEIITEDLRLIERFFYQLKNALD